MMPGRVGSAGTAKRSHEGASRRRAARIRRLVAGALGPVLAAGTSLVPAVAVTAAGAAALTAVAVAKAAPARAATTGPVLVLLQNGESTAPETTVLENAGYSVTQITPSTWAGEPESYFQQYAALVIGDPSSGGSCSGLLPVTGTAGSGQVSIGTNWQAAVTGNVAVLGTAPALPGTSGADSLIADSVGYAAAGYDSSASTGTGLYVSLNCEYSASAAGTSVPLLNGVEGIGTAGGLTVNGSLSCSDPGTVNAWEASQAGTFGGFTSSSLGTGSNGFPSPACPVQEAFDSWPAMFTAVGYDAAPDATVIFTASDGQTGQPYILLGAPVSGATASLAASQGGEVPAGTTTGGQGNAAAGGVTQALAAGSVNTEDGDFTQSDTDVSIPGYGPGLEFSRTYDAQTAQQQTETGAPGPLGYGWTDNWASSLQAARPVAGDIYTVDGLRSDDGLSGGATSAGIGNPDAVAQSGGNTYIADTAGNRILEVAGSSGTQWGISMTAGDVYVIVGSPTGAPGLSASGTPASSFTLKQPEGIAIDNSGDVFIADTGHDEVLELAASSSPWGAGHGDIPSTATAGDVYYVAGTTTSGDGSDGVAATSSQLAGPAGLFIGGNAGTNLYIADTGNNRVQMVSPSGQTRWGQSMSAFDVYTVAGSSAGTAGSSGDKGAATSALLDAPQDIGIDTNGNLEIADAGNCRVQEVAKAAGTYFGDSMTADDIYTVAGSSAGTCGLGSDGVAGSSSDLNDPTGVSSDGTIGNLYITDAGNNRVQMLAASTGTSYGQSVTDGDVYTVAGSSAGTAGSSGNGGASTSAKLDDPYGVVNDDGGDLWIADNANAQVRKASGTSPYDITGLAGNGYTLANTGNGGPAFQAGLNVPGPEAFDPAGDVFIADGNNNRVEEIAAYSHTQFGISMTGGDIYTVAGSATGVQGDSGDGGKATSALLYDPQALVLDAAGDLFIDDGGNSRIQEVPVASGTQFGISMTANDMYTIAGSSSGAEGDSGDGGKATSALMTVPEGIALDAKGDVYIADTFDNQVREVPAVTGTQWGQSMTAGYIYTIAGSTGGTAGSSGDGGKAASALLHYPSGLATDAAGNIYISDFTNDRIQEIAAVTGTQRGTAMAAGDIYTIAGKTGSAGKTGDGGPAASAYLDDPTAVAASPSGDVYIADSLNNRIQEVAAASGTQWSQSMTAGDMYTVGGSVTGASGNTGDGGPATSALMNDTEAVSIDPAGDLYVTDLNNNRLREITATTTATIAPAPGQVSSLASYPGGTAPGGLTITQPGGAQVTFYAQSSGSCAAPYVTAGQYCALPQDTGASLTDSGGTYAYTPAPGSDTYTYNPAGQLTAETDPAGNELTITYDSPAPGASTSGTSTAVTCPSAAASCETITAASGRALVLGWNQSSDSGQVTSVTDPMNRTWTYAYDASGDLTTVSDPTGSNVTSYTYGAGSGNTSALLAADLLTITEPDAQPGYSGPDASPGADTVISYDNTGRVTSVTDPMGYQTTVSWCVNAAAGDCMDAATGTGFVTVTDPDGNATVYDYDQGTLADQSEWTGGTGATLTSETAQVPDTTEDGTSAAGTLDDTSSTDGDGNTTTYAYNADADPTTTTSPSPAGGTATTTTGYTSVLQAENCDSNAEATVTCAQDPGPSPVAPGGTISPPSSAPPEGLTWTLYDTDGNQLYQTTGVYSPSGSYEYSRTTYQLYDGNTVTLNGTNVSCTATPPSPSLPCATINADGVVTQLAYDAQGDLTSSSAPDGNAGNEQATTSYAYDADGEQTATTTPDGNVSGANAGNYTTTTAWNADGQKASVTQGGGAGATVTPRTTSYGYDGDGNQATVTDARGNTTTTTYNADNQTTLVTNPDKDSTLTCYDGDGNTAQTVPAVGVAANSLTAASCPTSYPSGYSDRLAADATVSTFNAAGNMTSQTTPAPTGQTGYETSTYTYDGNGNLLTTTAPPTSNASNAPDQVTLDAYDTAGKLASQTTGYGTSAASTVSYCYDPDGDQTSVVYADGNTTGTTDCETSSPWAVPGSAAQAAYQTTYSYDSAGELVSTVTPANTASGAPTTTATYDPAGNMLTRTDPDGVTTTWTYGTDGNVIKIAYSGGTAPTVTYGYDANGQKTYMTDATGASSFAFNPFGELTSATDGAGQTVSYSYNVDGDLTGITYPLPSTAAWANSDTVTYGYDDADQMSSVTDFNGNQISIASTADGLPDSEALGSSGDTITTSYDNTDNPSEIAVKNSSSVLQSFSYSDSPAGTILTETDTPSSANSPADYTYDAQGQVTSDTAGTGATNNYGFDASGNLTTLPTGATGTYNDAGELASSALSGTTTDYTYNADGEQLTATQGSATESSATWNGAGQLATYDNSAADMTAATYDGNGMRASTTITPSGGSAVTQGYVWNTVPQVPELLMDGTNAYIYDGDLAPAEQVNLSTGTITYLVVDGLGSVRGCITSSGTISSTTSYDAWGNPETAGGLTATTPFGFAGGYTDSDGLIYLLNRYYQPSTGQFISVDPEISQTLQPYEYADGNPVSNTDPSGQTWWWSSLGFDHYFILYFHAAFTSDLKQLIGHVRTILPFAATLVCGLIGLAAGEAAGAVLAILGGAFCGYLGQVLANNLGDTSRLLHSPDNTLVVLWQFWITWKYIVIPVPHWRYDGYDAYRS